jgi:hypothetical protein
MICYAHFFVTLPLTITSCSYIFVVTLRCGAKIAVDMGRRKEQGKQA